MSKKESKEKPSKKVKASDKEVKSDKKGKKAEAVGKAKYEYPKDCTTDADKKKYRSLIRAGKTWEGPGAAASTKKADKKGKKDPGTPKAVILDGKGKKVREEDRPEGSKKKKKKESSED